MVSINHFTPFAVIAALCQHNVCIPTAFHLYPNKTRIPQFVCVLNLFLC